MKDWIYDELNHVGVDYSIKDNVEFCHSGFLQCQPEEKAEIIHTKWAFHHLPD